MNWYLIHSGQFGYPQPEDNPLLPQTFDYSKGCTKCGIGKVQYAPVRFRKEPLVSNKAFTGLNWLSGEFFVTDTARRILEDNGITGMAFSRPVLHKNDEPLERWFQIRPDNRLPPAIRVADLTVERCDLPTDESALRFIKANNPNWLKGPFCGSRKYNVPADKDWKVRYELHGDVLGDRPDMVRACEWMGSGAGAFQEVFVSQRFKDICDTFKMRGLFFHPTKLIG